MLTVDRRAYKILTELCICKYQCVYQSLINLTRIVEYGGTRTDY